MAAAKKKKTGKSSGTDFKWIALIFLLTVLISAVMSFVSSNLLEGSGLVLSFVILIGIVLIGILFDIIGVAVTAADEAPFHAMASRKVPEAADALRLIRCGVGANRALDMGITNKAFDAYEQSLIRDVIAARIPAKLDRSRLFTD